MAKIVLKSQSLLGFRLAGSKAVVRAGSKDCPPKWPR